jgi:hypothetical protein
VTNAAQINSEHELCHGPYGGSGNQTLVGGVGIIFRAVISGQGGRKTFIIGHFPFLICHFQAKETAKTPRIEEFAKENKKRT